MSASRPNKRLFGDTRHSGVTTRVRAKVVQATVFCTLSLFGSHALKQTTVVERRQQTIQQQANRQFTELT